MRIAADRGASSAGLDASEGLLAIARSACPRPTWGSASSSACRSPTTRFDAVTGFCSIFFADDPVAALRNAGRVAKPGAPS